MNYTAPTLLLFVLSSSAFAADFFTEDFSSNSLGTNLAQSGGSGTIDTSGGNVVFSGAGDNGRAWVGTVDTDYATLSSFVAEVTIEIEDANETNSFNHYFGLGVGDDYDLGGAPSFDEPVVGPVAFFGVRGAAGVLVGDEGPNDSSVGFVGSVAGVDLGVGVYVLRLNYDGVANLLSLSIDDGFGFTMFGTSIDTSDNGFDASNSRIFLDLRRVIHLMTLAWFLSQALML